MKNAIILLLISVLFLACAGNSKKVGNKESTNDKANKTAVQPVNDYTLEMFDQVQMGMNIAEVVKIMKKEGVLLTQASGTADQSASGKVTAKMYTWTNKDASYIEVTFVEGIVVSKNNINLK